MKVIWICNFSNSQIREKLDLSKNIFEIFIRKLLKIPQKQWNDYGAWITNGIKEFQSCKEVELHVISPHRGISRRLKSFKLKRIKYYFFKPGDDSLFFKGYKYLFSFYKCELKKSRKIIKKLIKKDFQK